MTLRSWWREYRGLIARTAIYWLALFVLAVVQWLQKYFDAVTVPQLLYYLHFSNGVVMNADHVFLVTFCLECLLAPTLVSVLLVAVALYLRTEHAARSMETAVIKTRVSFRTVRMIALFTRMLPFLALTASVCFCLTRFSAFTYVRSMFLPDRFATIYVDPRNVTVQAAQPKNLVLIYVESLETAYGDKEVFGEDLIKDVTAIPGTSFQSYRGLPGTNWTMAAIVATQCGVPLQFVVGANPEMDYRHVFETFLPHAVCLGDVLKRLGYHNVFMGGAHLDFAAKKIFLANHGYDELYGANEWRKNHAAQTYNDWGLFDDDLLRIGKDKLLELAASGGRFNLTLLTVDTHQPVGHYSPSCKQRGAVRFEDIVKCTSAQLSDFVDFAVRHDLLKTTDIIIIGDHLSWPNPVYAQLQRVASRRIFNKFIAQDLPPRNRENIVPFDLFPSTLEFLGIAVDGKRLGLGCSAFFTPATHCPDLQPTDQWLGELQGSRAYAELW